MKVIRALSLLLSAMFVLTACSTWDSLTSKLPWSEPPPRAPRFTDNPRMGAPTQRQYKRVNRQKLEEESDLGSQAGSTWVNDGQTAYLFSQNKLRKEGDVLGVKLDGAAQKQVETKVSVIKKLIKQLEEQARLEAARKAGGEAAAEAARAPAAAKTEDKDEKVDLSDIQNIPTRIIEKTPEGNYRVKGSMPFMIDKREYKVMVTGMIRPEDYNDEGVSSSKLIDSQFDVISLRKRAQAENYKPPMTQ